MTGIWHNISYIRDYNPVIKNDWVFYLTMKNCSKCGQEKPIEMFYFRKDRNVYESACKICRQQSVKIYLEKNRIDSSKGYIEDNIVLCCSIVNKIKQNLSIDELIEWCDLIKYRRVSPLPYMQ